MPAKMARSAPRPPFGPSEVTVAVRNSLLSCRKAGKPRTSAPIWESSGESRLMLCRPGRSPLGAISGHFQDLSRYSRLIACGAPPPRRCPGRRQSLINLIEELARDTLPYGTAILVGALGERLGGEIVSYLASFAGLVLGIYFFHKTLEIILAS